MYILPPSISKKIEGYRWQSFTPPAAGKSRRFRGLICHRRSHRAGPEELLALVRNHWHIENRLHYVRDFTYDEDRCRAYVRHLPRNLACLTNVAIAIVRCSGRFRYLPEANRHYAARAQDALDAILIAPTA